MFSSAEKWEKAGGHYRSAGNFFKASMKCEQWRQRRRARSDGLAAASAC